MMETNADLFSLEERLSVPISRIAHPDDIQIFGTHWGDETYYGDYCGIAAKYGPRRILEIGVRYGYSGIALCDGALRSGFTVPRVSYTGIDAECYGASEPGGLPYHLYRSNAIAAENFKRFFEPDAVHTRFVTLNTQQEALPPLVTSSKYDLIGIDGEHSYKGTLHDMAETWPLLREGGLMLVDDMGMEAVARAVFHFVQQVPAQCQLHPNERMLMIIRKGMHG
jgi:Methyltransferase domain